MKNYLPILIARYILLIVAFYMVQHINIKNWGISFNMALAIIAPVEPEPTSFYDQIIEGSNGSGSEGIYTNKFNTWTQPQDFQLTNLNIQEVVVYGRYPLQQFSAYFILFAPRNPDLSNIWNIGGELGKMNYWDYELGVSGGWVPEPSPSSPIEKTPLGDPIDPVTGLANVTERFENDMDEALIQFCQTGNDFTQLLENYSALNYIFTYPQDFIDYMTYFINQVKGGGPWDLKYEGHGYSKGELNNMESAVFNGEEYRRDDFGNITFGIAAAAYGFPIEFAKTGAGLYQLYKQNSEWSYISSYFDDPQDSQMIELGYNYFYEMGGCLRIK